MTSPPERLTAAIADRYRIQRELGAGGMATVYLADDLKHDRAVAIKVLHPELAAALGGERFLSEIKTTAKLQHPHILPLLDSGSAPSHPDASDASGGPAFLYYVMPYVSGETLRGRLERERQLPIDDALRIAREVADALGSAHALGIIHRDIKPENILLKGGHALVADFGIALAVQTAAGPRMTQTGLSLGTPQYMSPEQAMGERHIDARADIYALGAVVYEMLTGDPPFTGSSLQAIVAKVMTEKPTAPSAVRDTVTPGVEDAVLRALSKLPADRFASASDFALALDAPGRFDARRSAKSPAPRRAAIAAATAVVAVSLAGGAWWLGRRAVASPAVRAAISSSILLPEATPLQPAWPMPEGLSTLALSPDGSSLVFVGRKGPSTQLFIRRLSSFDIRPIDGTDGAYSPFFSPGGDAVAFFAGPQLKRFSFNDQRVSVIRAGMFEPWGGVWAPDGRIIVSRQRATELIVLNGSGDSLGGIRCPGACSYPELLPDGQHVIAGGPTGIRIFALTDGSMRPLSRFGDASELSVTRGGMVRLDGDGHLLWVALNGEIVAAPFDAARARFTGPPAAVAEDVRVESGRGAAQFALAPSGTIAFAPGPLMSVGILVRADRNGKLDTIPAPPADYNSLDLSPDGRRVLAQVGAPNGEYLLNVIDVSSGQITPWLAAKDRFGTARWDADGRSAYTVSGKTVLRGDPMLSAPPETVRVNGSRGFQMLPGGKLYLETLADTVLVQHVDKSGAPLRIVTAQRASGGVTRDNRWLVSDETVGGSPTIVARALDGSGRRFIVPGSERFGMVFAASGKNELIMGELLRGASSGVANDAEAQAFWSLPYTPTAAEPFGAPKRLFAAPVADFPGRNYAVDRMAQRFVFKQHVTVSSPREIRLIQHWHAALSARASSRPSTR